MPAFYRFINCAERKQLQSTLLCQITLVTLIWYCIEIIQSNNESCKILKREYSFISRYINMPDNCTCWIIFWFRINRCTMYITLPFCVLVWHGYYILPCHILTCICIYIYIYLGRLYSVSR